MRNFLLFPLIVMATPAFGQSAPPRPAPISAVPPELLDPGMPAQMGRMAGALSQAFMRLPVGELEAAIEGRPVTPADRRKTVGDEARRGNPNIERDLQRDVASSAGRMQSSARAMQQAMPAIAQSMSEAVAAIERATANLPNPTYPRR